MDEHRNDNIGKVVVGLLLLFVLIRLMGSMWTMFIIVPGGALIYAAATSTDKNKMKLIYPGAIITGTGVILLYQSMTGHWASWVYAWMLYPVFVGMASRWYGEKRNKPNKVAKGEAIVRGWLIAFVVTALLFEIVIFNFWSIFWLAVIAWGAWHFMGKKGDHKFVMSYDEKPKNDEYTKRKNDEVVIV